MSHCGITHSDNVLPERKEESFGTRIRSLSFNVIIPPMAPTSRCGVKHFPSQRTPCVPAAVGMLAGRPGCGRGRSGALPAVALVPPSLSALHPSGTQRSTPGSLSFPIFAQEGRMEFGQLSKCIWGGVLILSLLRKVHAGSTQQFYIVPWAPSFNKHPGLCYRGRPSHHGKGNVNQQTAGRF